MVRYNGLVWSNIAVLNYYHPIHMILGNALYLKQDAWTQKFLASDEVMVMMLRLNRFDS